MSNNIIHDDLVDARHLHCPQPIILCKAKLDKLNIGDVFTLCATETDISRLIHILVDKSNHTLLSHWNEGRDLFFTIRKGYAANRLAPRTNYSLQLKSVLEVYA